MAAQGKKKSSCMGLFMKAFVITALILANLGIAGVMIAVKFFGADYATWTDLSHYTSYPWMMIFGVLGVAACSGLLLSTVGAAVSLAFGDGGGKSSGPKPAPRAKPQSNRRTTI